MYQYRITFKAIIVHLWVIIFGIIVFTILPFWMINRFGKSDLQKYIVLSAIFFTISAFPHLFLFTIYLFWNRGVTFSFNISNNTMVYTRGEKSVKFRIQDIDFIERKTTHLFGTRELRVLPWDDFNYSRIVLKDKQEIKITSLVVPDLDFQQWGVRTITKKVFFPI